ncbi:MAG: sulfatase [Nitrospirae bacterium]|nr:sulfatase [Nitrospirota bacterium]
MKTKGVSSLSYSQVFRITFVVFFLFLMGDAFYRWDGFKYYASFAEFLPNLSLVSLFWSILATVTALLVWLSIRLISSFALLFKWKNAQHFFLFLYLVVALATITYFIKRFVWPDIPLSFYIKLAMLFVIILMSIPIYRLLQNKYDVIHERLIPLVWLFGIFVIISVPIVVVNATLKGKIASEHIASSGVKTDRPNIILITFDAMTTRDMSIYGYHRPTTPFMTEWAKKANLFSGLKAAGNWTSPSMSSIITGKRVWTHRVFQPHASHIDKGNTENIPKLLKQNGYYNMAFLSNWLVPFSRNGIDKYFDIFHKSGNFSYGLNMTGLIEIKLQELFGDNFSLFDWIVKKDFVFGKLLDFMFVDVFEKRDRYYYNLPKMFDTFIHNIGNNPPEPFFAWMHIWQPHTPYIPPAPFKGMFGPVSKKSSASDVLTSRDRYDELVRYCDEEFNKFINSTQIKEKLKNTIIIVSADHGESFEHGYQQHGGPHLYEQVTSIPLIIKEPGQEDGQVVNDLVGQIDIPATILDLADITVPEWMEGRSLVPFLRGEKLEARPVYSMSLDSNPSNSRITKGSVAIWEGNYKLVYYIDKDEKLLFNLEQDPAELNNLYDKEHETGQRLLNIIRDNIETVNKNYLN